MLSWGLVTCLWIGLSLRAEEIPARTAEGFAVPQPNPTFTFPRDHGAHPDYKIEWWYLTGHLYTTGPEPRRFGFQATFFRSASPLDTARRPAPAAFGHDQIYLAHMALIDARTGRFLHQERLNRAGWDAAADTATLDVRNGDWALRFLQPGQETLLLTGGIRGEARFSLNLVPKKPLVRFGAGGYSRKGAAPTAASYYLTFPRLAATGQLTLDGETLPVTGEAWMDHEYSSSQLDQNQVGWDWLSAQLKDGRELMFYRLRTRTGGTDPASTLTWIDREGRAVTAPYRWEPLTYWTSPRTGARYPQRIRLVTTDPASGREVVFTVVPLHPDQELGGSLGGVTYWEGACRLLAEDESEVGSAYLELTGYDRALEVLR
ncbi:MAG: carotenoid 1,2-hydratase [Verrucomicrobia bacterium]|nr:carotenoid 1,2-hydratase [Verrucomicrobiota bacterium]